MSTGSAATVVGEIVSRILDTELRAARDSAIMRVSGFDRAEAKEIATRLDKRFAATPGQLVVIVGSREPVPGLDPRLLLPRDRLPTSYRNDRSVPYFVYVEVDRYSDEQSLKQITPFNDRSVLSSDDEAAAGRRKELLAIAWEQAGGNPAALPVALTEVAETVFQTLARLRHPSLRSWVDFVNAASAALAAEGKALDETTVLSRVGLHLDRLGLFPDPDLSTKGANERVERLQINYSAREHRDPRKRLLDTDETIALAERTVFLRDDAVLADAEQKRIRRAIATFMEGGDHAPRVELGQWLQMFEKDRARGLGTRLLDHLQDKHPDLVLPFEDLEVTEPLDHNDPEAAKKLLEEGTEIVGAVSTRLRRAVERLAEPRSQAVADPIRHLISVLYELAEDAPEDETLSLELARVQRKGIDDARSLELFTFLYGPTLASVVQDGASGHVVLGVHPELAVYTPPARQRTTRKDDEEDDDEEKGWAPLVLHVRSKGAADELRRFEWRPLEHAGLVAFYELVRAADCDKWSVTEGDFASWTREALKGTPSGGSTTDAPEGITNRWLALRRERLAEFAQTGLDHSLLLRYADEWAALLHDLYSHHVPHGTPDPEVARFLEVDTWNLHGGAWAILATHPLRLRWIGQHLMQVGKYLESLMDSGLRLNPVNDGFFFGQLENLSPHEQPAVLTAGEALNLAIREEDWHQHYAVIRTAATTENDWLADLDDVSIDELSRVVGEYIEAHPHKSDGVSILLLVREHGARLLGRFLQKTFQSPKAPDEATLHVFAPRSEFAEIERAVALVDDAEERSERAFPRMNVVLHEWADTRHRLPSLASFGEKIDLAVVPNLFGIHTRVLENSRSVLAGDQTFEPWNDPATYVEASGDPSSPGQNVSRLLLPRRYDPVLWQWSTVNVRGFRNQPVGSTEIDYVALQVRFDLSRELYESLHEISHWVVTLDPFVGRDQIEALPERPDVILVRPRVGKSLAYTLVVSSSTGRSFVVNRLSNRLSLDLPASVGARARHIAEKLYDQGRQLSPGLVLRALGLGWASNELIGLSIARQLADEHERVDYNEGFVAWISLDDHMDWFGRGRRTRADLVRLSLGRVVDEDGEAEWQLGLLVVEAKMREQTNSLAAEQQVRNTLDLLQAALTPPPPEDEPSAERGPSDGRFWRAEIMQAIDQLPRTMGGHGSPAFQARGSDGVTNRVPEGAREAFRSGRYKLLPPGGFICLVSPETKPSVERSVDGYVVVRVDAEEMARVLLQVAAGDTPTGVSGASSAPAGEPPVSAPAKAPPTPTSPAAIEASSSADDASRAQVPPIPAPVTPTPPPKRKTSEVRIIREGTTEQVEARYQKLLDVFAQHDVRVVRPDEEPFAEGPGFYVFRVRPSQGVRPDTVRRYVEDVKLSLELSSEANIRSYVDAGCVVFEIPKRDEERYYVTAEELWARTEFGTERLYAPLGQDIRGRIVGIDFSSSDSPHLLIAGQTGSGKSIALETILVGLARHYSHERLRMALVDPKATELLALEHSPHLLAPIASDAADAIQFLEDGVEEMQRRRDLFKSVNARDLPQYNQAILERGGTEFLPWQLIVLDEYADLVSDKDERKKIEGYLQRLSQKARASGIHIIVATQRPSADVISTVVRANLPAQLALRVRSAIESNVIMAEPGAETLAGKGDAFLRTARGTTRVQCGKVT